MWYVVLSVVLVAYVLLNLIMPKIAGGLGIYFLTIISWITVAYLTLKISMKEDNLNLLKWRLSKHLILTSAIIGALQIAVLIFAGIFTAFGRSPYAFTPLAILVNTAYFSSALIALELTRAYLIKSCPKKRIFTGIALAALFYTLISFTPARFLSLNTPAKTTKFIGSSLLPIFAQSLYATYLALLGGPTASIAYMGTLEAFEWLSPILPNPPWTMKALIDTLVPVVGFLAVNWAVSPLTLIRVGVIGRREAVGRQLKSKPPLGWMTIALIAVILIWSSTGLLGFQPSIIASGSMRPTLEVGDIAVTVPTPTEKIRVGDIIQYWRSGDKAPTIHRVIEINRVGGTIYIVTKGDANTAPDEPIMALPTQKVGRVILVIPKIGWISIHLKTAIANAWSLIINNPTATYIIFGITLISTAYGIHTYRNQPLRKLRRRLRR